MSRSDSLLSAALSGSLSRRRLLRGAFGLVGAGVALGAGAGLAGCSAGDDAKTLNVFIWSEYIPDYVFEGFTKETGITVNQSLYGNNEEMLGKFRIENPGTFDILQPTGYMVDALIHQGALQKLDRSLLPNMRNIGSQYLRPDFDPDNDYCVPFMGNCTIISYNADMVKGRPSSWADMLAPEFAGEIVALNDMREVLMIAAHTVGLTGNETDDAGIAKIEAQANALKPNIKIYDSDNPKGALSAGDVAAGMVWTAEVALAQRENPKIQAVFPKEGANVGTDHWVIPAGARHYENAHKFIDYVLRADVAAQISNEFPYVQCNVEAIKLLPPEVQENPVLNVPADVYLGGNSRKTLPPDVLRRYDKIWTNMKG